MPDLTSLATPAATLLKASGQSIAVAESSCGGLISAALVSIPGASDYYVGGSTIYTRVAQKGLLLVPDETMEGMRQQRAVCATERPDHPKGFGNRLGTRRNRSQWTDRKPVRGFVWPRLFRRERNG